MLLVFATEKICVNSGALAPLSKVQGINDIVAEDDADAFAGVEGVAL
mgnify:CR=1 FL=1